MKGAFGCLAAALLLVFALVAVPAAQATIVNFSSDLVNEGNNMTINNTYITPIGVWAVAPWVSFENSGLGGTSPPNTTISGLPTVTFTENVFLPGTNNTGWITGWADDTMSIWIFNSLHPAGLLLHAANDTPSPHCAGQPIACMEGMHWTGALDNTILVQGMNTFAMPAYQLWGYQFGIAYQGEVNSTPEVPEPITMALFGSGLLALGLFRRARQCRTVV